jgi:sugar lactone lactonase YvrE
MKRGIVLSVFVVLALMAFFSAASHPAADEAPKPGTLLTVAGIGKKGFAGDGGPATQAMLNNPYGLAFDAAGTLFIADRLNNRVRKVSPEGIITTVTGSGPKTPQEADGGPALDAKLTAPEDVAVDGSGNLFIADSGQQRVRKVSPDGIITTVAGNGDENFSGDGGIATEAALLGPGGLAVDAVGNLFIADTRNNRVRKVSPDGIITTVAGNGQAEFSGDGGRAVEAALNKPFHIAVDTTGSLFIADWANNRVRKVGLDGIITTVAGTGEAGFAGDGGPAREAKLFGPDGVAVDSAGNLFIADLYNHRVRKVTPDGIITTVAGGDKLLFSGEGGPATEAGLRGPYDVAVDAAGNLFIVDSGFLTGRQDGMGEGERVLKVVEIAAPGLIAGKPFPKPSEP